MWLRFVQSEIRRMFARPRLWLIVALIGLLGSIPLLQGHIRGDEARVGGALSLGLPSKLALLWPLLAGIAVAGSVSEDRTVGYLLAVRSRGLSHLQYVSGKALAMFCTGAGAAALCCVAFFLAALFTLPWGQSVLHSLQPIGSDPFPGPIPSLFQRSPVLNDLVGVSLIILGTAALSLTGIVVGALWNNEYVAMALPLGLFLIGVYLPRSLRFLSPNVYLEVWWQYRVVISAHNWPWAGYLYWGVLSAVCTLLGFLFFPREE